MSPKRSNRERARCACKKSSKIFETASKSRLRVCVLVIRQLEERFKWIDRHVQKHVFHALSLCCSRPRLADRRCLWPSTLERGRQRSARFPGAMLCWHLYTWTHSRNRIRSVTSSQFRMATIDAITDLKPQLRITLPPDEYIGLNTAAAYSWIRTVIQISTKI